MYQCRKSELQAEVQSLKNQLQQASASAEYYELPRDFSDHRALPSSDQRRSNLDEVDGGASFGTDIDQFLSPSQTAQNQFAIEQEPQLLPTSKAGDGSWAVGDLIVGQSEVQDCFNL